MKTLATRSARYASPALVAIFLTAALLPAAAHGSGPQVAVGTQPIVDSRVVIPLVVSDGPGWLVIHAEAGGKPGPVIGYSPVRDGTNTDVAVTVDTARAPEVLFAMLHTDAGQVGVYEFPGADAPVRLDGAIVMTQFQVGQAGAEGGLAVIQMKARRYEFVPNVIRVRAGAQVELHIVSQDVTHGFALRGLGVNERINPGRETVVRFTAPQAGRYTFACSVFCGSGHRGMTGELIVE